MGRPTSGCLELVVAQLYKSHRLESVSWCELMSWIAFVYSASLLRSFST